MIQVIVLLGAMYLGCMLFVAVFESVVEAFTRGRR